MIDRDPIPEGEKDFEWGTDYIVHPWQTNREDRYLFRFKFPSGSEPLFLDQPVYINGWKIYEWGYGVELEYTDRDAILEEEVPKTTVVSFAPSGMAFYQEPGGAEIEFGYLLEDSPLFGL